MEVDRDGLDCVEAMRGDPIGEGEDGFHTIKVKRIGGIEDGYCFCVPGFISLWIPRAPFQSMKTYRQETQE